MFSQVTSRGVAPKSILDVGATTRVWEDTIRDHWPSVDYRSLDIDRTHRHDFHSFDELDRQFDLVTCFEVLEHCSPKHCVELVRDCVGALSSGGLILLSVPNVLCPGIQPEFTHTTAFSYYDLPGLADWSGLRVLDLCRVCLTGWRFRFVHGYCVYPIHRLLRIDYCQMIMLLAQKHAEAVSR